MAKFRNLGGLILKSRISRCPDATGSRSQEDLIVKFIATAEHVGGKSVGHPCKLGIFCDPTDSWQQDIEATTLGKAEGLAQTALAVLVEEAEMCRCRQERHAGSNSWWSSVCISLWPQDSEAMTAWLADGGQPECDPYGLIPVELLPVVCE